MGVHIFWDSRVPAGLSNPVTECLSTALNMPLSRIDNGMFPLEGYNVVRNQFDVVKILSKVDLFRSLHPELFQEVPAGFCSIPSNRRNYEKVLLVTDGDLYSSRDSYLFGAALPKLGVAVVSITRLQNKIYNLHPDDFQLMKRIVTEGCHEIGHLYGLKHCDNPSCIMSFPHSVADLDRKETFFCGKCQMELESRVQGGF